MPIGRFYEKWEIDFLKENWGKISARKIAKRLNRSPRAIITRACELKLPKRFIKYKTWENSFLKETYGKIPTLEICIALKRSYSGTTQQASKLGLKTKLWITDRIGKPQSKEHRKNISIGLLGKNKGKKNVMKRPEVRKKVGKALKKIWADPNSAFHSKEFRRKLSSKLKKLWKNPEYVKKVLAYRSPNNSENKILFFMEKNKIKAFFNGGKQGKNICGKIPDFVDWQQKKILELFSDFHKGYFSQKTNSPDYFSPTLRKRLFAREGYKTLIVWEHELRKNPLQIENKIVKFFKK